MDKPDYARLRILLVAGKSHAAQTLRGVLHLAGIAEIVQIADRSIALKLLCQDDFDAVFCEDEGAAGGRQSFPLAVRHTPGVRNPMLPAFVFRDRAWRSRVEMARDTGATDFITCPVSPKTILDKLTAAISSPRPFIKAPDFFGPDRRATARAGFFGEERRKRVPRKIKVAKSGRAMPEPGGETTLI